MDTPMQIDDTLGTSFGERFIEDYLGQFLMRFLKVE